MAIGVQAALRRAASYMTNGPPVACCATNGPFLSSGGGSALARDLALAFPITGVVV